MSNESDHSTSNSHKHEGAGGDTLCTEDISAIAPTEATSVSSGEYHSAVEEEPTPVVQKTIVSSGLVTNTQIVLFNFTVERVFSKHLWIAFVVVFLAEMGRIPCCGRPESSSSNI